MFSRFWTFGVAALRRRSQRPTPVQMTGGFVVVLLVAAVLAGPLKGLAQQMIAQMPIVSSPVAADTTQAMHPAAFTVGNHPSHPDTQYPAYLMPSVFSGEEQSALNQFHHILDIYSKRQGVDDNFTIRVFDSRTYEVLGVYSVDHLQSQWQSGATMDWLQVDRERRQLSRRMVDKHVREGYPREHIAVRWGRANQIQEAYERDLPFAEYEIRLAQYLGMSLLPTMLGVVETFNQDDLVSSAGARSRYQMMPSVLRQFDVSTYTLPTNSGQRVRVREELHPLIAMEPAFTLMRGYINAVGHELPGLSAYHTGPSNIFHVYRSYLMEQGGSLDSSPSVVDAFVWGLTDGFDTVSESSTFKTRSRGYIPAVMGAMRAYNPNIIDPSYTQRAVRVQLAPRERTTLRDLLADLADERLDWGPDTYASSMYERFRHLNPHIQLPESADGSVPDRGNIVLTDRTGSTPVRFFLPLGAPDLLAASGRVALNDEATFVFDESTYTHPVNGTRTEADRAYDRLVERIGAFGFTSENRRQLNRLYERFKELERENPTHYRQIQLSIIETHRRVWLSRPWREMARAAEAATRLSRVNPQAPHEFDVEPAIPSALRGAQ
ncbi:MAG: hypothetical protein PPP56_12755 [Longimonas sp.]|uniref:hypothetical protein n=1 Tax=Longimonas sp. TaxID=2039626 RepID=UPI003359C7BC